MMRCYEIGYEINGKSGTAMIEHCEESLALAKFRRWWSTYGDEFTGSCWVNASWAIGG